MDPATDWVDGRLGTALDFDGSDDYLELPEPNVGSSPTLFTVSGWIKPESGGRSRFITPQSSGRDHFLLHDRNDADFGIFVNESANTNLRRYTTPNGTMPYGQWSHFAAIVDEANNDIRLYVNGQLEKNATDSDPISGWSGTWIMGQRGNNSDYLNGKLDDVRIYDRALTEANVQDLYESGFSKVNTSRKLDNINGLQGWWTMDGKDVDWSGSSGQIKDNSGSGNNGTTNGGMTNSQSAAQGRVGQALDFGSDENYIVTNNFLSNELSLSAWIKTGNDADRDVIAASYDNFSDTQHGMRTEITSNGNFRTVYGDGTSDATRVSGSFLNDNQWHHVVSHMDATNGVIKHYIDGSLKDKFTGLSQLTIDHGDFTIGQAELYTGGTEPQRAFDGLIDDVRVYEKELLDAEVNRLYNATRPSPINTSRTDQLTDGLVGFWSMNGQDVDLSDSSAEVKDVTSNGNDGDAKNGAKPAIGKLGQGFGFDGTDDKVVVGDDASLDISSSYTEAAWVKLDSTAGEHDVVSKNTNQWNLEMQVRDGRLRAGFEDCGGDNYLTAGGSVSANQWHHLVVTYDGSTVYGFIDGVRVWSTNGSGTPCTNYQPLLLGQGTGKLDGTIDNVRIYDRALSESEVKQLYRLGGQ